MGRQRYLLCLLVIGGIATASPVFAQMPMDGFFTQLMASLPTWAVPLIGILGIGGALGLGFALHRGPEVIIGLVVVFIMIALIGMSASGRLAQWALTMF